MPHYLWAVIDRRTLQVTFRVTTDRNPTHSDIQMWVLLKDWVVVHIER